ncbi:MAG TPA: DUF4906 domain-containing protein [Candidatus Coprenecus merdigallinarum]|nr:DUF4906 domain-containing protein [Candidatus Coprenecus merdigallinarum]
MKRYIHHIILGAALLLMSAGCARYDEDRLAIGGDRVPLSDLSMDFMVDGADVYTKAGQSVLAENRVTGLYVLLFNEDGRLVHSKSYYVGGGKRPDRYDAQIISYTEKNSEDGGASMGIIPGFFEGYNGNAQSLKGQFTFYAVANYNETVEKQLENVTEESQLQDMTVKFVTNGNVFRSNFLMVATEKNVRFSAVDNDNGGVTVERIGVTLRLRRVDAKVSFRVTVDIPGARNVAFEDMIYRVHNVPNVTYLIERQKGEGTDASAWDASVADNDYSCMMDETYDTFDTTYTDRVGGEFAFYLRETRLDPKQEITSADKGDKSSLYALREAWDNENVSGKTPVHGGGRTYTYAPEYGTFVEITGNLSYSRINENGQEEQVDGDVTYIIHLGETGNDPDDEDAVNNYDVRRNVRYIYNVNIKGINDMEVEVTEQDELRPGVEGDLVISTNRKVEMDAHYGRVLLTLDKNNLKEAGWSAVTPLGTIEYNPETGQINAPYDYKWVLFAINRHFDPDNDGSSMVKFPGIQAYDGGVKFYENGVQRSEEEIKNDIAGDDGNNFENGLTFKKSLSETDWTNYYASPSLINYLDDDACLRDINQLIHYLKQELEDPESTIFDGDHVYITAFVDEFTYIYDPRQEDYIHPGKSVHEVAGNNQDADRRLLLWKEYTNVGDRTLNILPMTNISYSLDKNTSITNAYITLSQKSIKTIYDTGDTGPADAWGLEVVNETGRLEIPDHITIHGSRTNSKSNGRGNFMNFWINNRDQSELEWTKVMTIDQRIENAEGLDEDYRDALHACITRNRDLDGNNRIDEDEIYWYLASEAQLSGLFIGQPSLSQDAWLYQGDGSEYSHVVSSTSSNMRDRGSYRILWAEEGASWGPVSGDGKVTAYDYRCVRNLGIDIAYMDESPAHYASVTDDDGFYTVDVGYLNDRALRSAPDDGINLPLDHERSQNNRPYAKFDVRKEVVYDGPVWLEMRDMLMRNENPCPEGWRVPNQREMLIMMSTLTSEFSAPVDWTGNYGIATTFSFNGTGLYSPQPGTVRDERWGFLTENTNLVLYNPNNPNNGQKGDSEKPLKFRCVRDNLSR